MLCVSLVRRGSVLREADNELVSHWGGRGTAVGWCVCTSCKSSEKPTSVPPKKCKIPTPCENINSQPVVLKINNSTSLSVPWEAGPQKGLIISFWIVPTPSAVPMTPQPTWVRRGVPGNQDTAVSPGWNEDRRRRLWEKPLHYELIRSRNMMFFCVRRKVQKQYVTLLSLGSAGNGGWWPCRVGHSDLIDFWRGCYLAWWDTKLITFLINTGLAFSSYRIRPWALNDETRLPSPWCRGSFIWINLGLNGNEVSAVLIWYLDFPFSSPDASHFLSPGTCHLIKCRSSYASLSAGGEEGKSRGNVT